MPEINVVTDRLRGVRMRGPNKAIAFCPAHNDVNERSLSVGVGDNEFIVLNCFAGCKTISVLNSIELEWTDLFPPRD